MKEKKRNCPQCGKEIIYHSDFYYNARKNNKKCSSCVKVGKLMGNDNSAKKQEVREKISQSKLGNKNPSKRPEVKEKMRIARLNWIKKTHGGPAFNPKACEYIEFLNKRMNFNFQHALNGKEKWIAGFAVDGYDQKQNVIFEYDEPHHHKTKQQNRDLYKAKCICERVNPSMFLRYSEKYDKLYDALTGQEYFI